MRVDWREFYELTKENPPWPLLVKSVALLQQKGDALDLGCGAGRDTRYLVAQGFNVTAVDKDPRVSEYLSDLPQKHLQIVQSSFEDFHFGAYDLVTAHYSLPFTPKGTFEHVFARLKQAIRPGGLFTGQLFGMNDTWNIPETTMSFVTKEKAQVLLSDMQIVEFLEEDKDGKVANGTPKHWHVFHIIAQKPIS